LAVRGGSLSIEHWSGGHEHVLVLRGEIDDLGADDVSNSVQQLCAAHARIVELDLAQLACIDHRGIGAVIAAKGICERHRIEFRLVPPKSSARIPPVHLRL